ncbi:MAG: chemotaxis protein CheD [Clostridia bacterium]|nr:chemotaxis protein CheD [Clostridia bacterium]MDD4047602.1 chemotaxis protein CheD [Clostridia bacterium]
MAIESVKVGIADFKIAYAPNNIITVGLGSCVGVCLWDSFSKIGGMAHIMLPSSSQARAVLNKKKYADSCIALLINEMCKYGINKKRLVAKLAGGARMFNFPGSNDIMQIGKRNIDAVKDVLNANGIQIVATDVGGSFGRTIELYTEDGRLLIKTINKGVKFI